MKNILITTVLLLTVLLAVQCDSPQTFTIKFDPSKEVSGQKFAISDISPGLPRDWDEYNYVTLEFKSTTSQRFQLGFTTDNGYNELRIASYVPHAWNKLVIPLKFYREMPDANADLASTYNQPRVTGWINLGGKRGPLHGVDSVGIRIRMPIGHPEIEIRSLSLSVEDPGDEYLGEIPAFDEFGQWNLGDFEGKIQSLEQLKSEWELEDNEPVSQQAYNYSRYGGYLQKQVKATGFFRTEKIDDRWWFVDPDGYLFLSVGIDCMGIGGDTYLKNINQCSNLFKELPPASLFIPSPRVSQDTHSASFSLWNLYRRYGDDYKEKTAETTIKRMEKWGINTIGNWSGNAIYHLNKKAFMLQLERIGIESGLMGLSDVYDPDFTTRIEASIQTYVNPYKDNPWLIGYFMGNEPAWLGQEARLCDIILNGKERPIQTELRRFLKEEDTPESRKEFIYKTFDIFLQKVNQILKKHDPQHLNLGIRFGNIAELDEQLLKISKNSFDVLSFNYYGLYPDKTMLNRALIITDLPMIIGEYHFGTVDRGLAQSLWQVDSQQERGIAFRYYTEQAYAHPGLIGTAWFQWYDQIINGRFDGENYNCGFIDVTDRPYPYLVEAVKETAKRLYFIHSGELKPVDQAPVRARGHENPIPDLWNE
jgi:predicted esterase YcpF (UPF0227 family)